MAINYKSEIELQPGVSSYTFRCELPAGLPTSVEGDHGYIRYSATVNLDRPMWPDQEFEEGFTVIKPLNLNLMPQLRYPQENEKRKTFSMCCLFCCCQSRPLFICARLPVTGFTPGEEISLDMRVINNSDSAVTNFDVKIVKHITFRPNQNSSKKKHDVVNVLERMIPQICPAGKTEIFQTKLEVPSLPPTDKTTSTICCVEYSIKISGHVSGCHTDPELSIPITIGTVPFMNPIGFEITQQPQLAILAPMPGQPFPTISECKHIPVLPTPGCPYPTVTPVGPSAPTMPSAETSAPQVPFIPYDPMAEYTNCDPPTYEQAIRGQVEIQGKIFAPVYPVFKKK